jgi:hypothetical protein
VPDFDVLGMQNVEIGPLTAPRSTLCTYAVQNVDPSGEITPSSTFCTRPIPFPSLPVVHQR